jgi:hypothetical protein
MNTEQWPAERTIMRKGKNIWAAEAVLAQCLASCANDR